MKKLLLFSLFALLASAMGWAATETWTKVTSTPDSWDGDYLIVYEGGKVAFDGSLTKLDAEKNTTSVTISNGTITTIDCNFYFTIASKTGGFSIKSKSGLYIGNTKTGKKNNGLDAGSTDSYTNTLSVTDGVATITSTKNSTILKYNATSGQERFRYFKSGQQPIALYKKQGGPAPEPTQVAAPTFSIKDGSKVGYGTEVTVSSAEGTNLFVSYGDVKDENVGANTKAITLPTEGETYTISAYAVDPTGTLTQSETVTATYTLLSNKVASIKEFLGKADTENVMVFTNPVTVVYQNGKDLYVKDNTGSLLIYNSGITGLVNGDVIEAGFSGVYNVYNGLPQLINPENLVKSATAGTPVEPTEVTIDLLAAAADYSEYVSLKKVKYDGSNFVDLKDETKKIAAYNNKYNLVTLTAGKVYNVTGIYSIYNSVQILPLTAEELQYVADVTVSPAFGDIAKGTEVTISCATEGAVLNGTIGTETLEGKALPYTFTASKVGKIEVGVWATKVDFEDSEVLTGTYNVCQPKVAALEIKPGFGTIEVGTEITISCATEGAVLNGMIGDTDVTNAPLPYTFTAEKEGEISVLLFATKDGYDESEVLDNKFIVKAAVPVAYRDVITPKDLGGKGSYTDVKNVEKGGAKYKVAAYVTTNIMQFNKGKNAGLVMTTAQTAASKLIITWNKSGAGKLEIYGKNTPYSAITDLNRNEGELIETVSYSADGTTTVDLGGNYTFIGIKPIDGVTYVTSFEFIWNEGAAGGADVTYTKASEAKAGNFAVLATADGKAVGRNADLSPVNVTVSGDAIGLAKGQTAIDEFEIKENGNNYQLYGGLASNGSRRYLTYDATGVTTVATADDNANVTFESKTAAGLLVKFNDGQYLMFNGTKFIKADYGEAVVQADGEILTPVIVFMSSSNVSTGVETVEFDENAEAQYFNLNGVQVKAENLTPGLYIVRQGNKVSKQVIR